MTQKCKHETYSGFPFMCSSAVTEKHADAPDVAVGGGAGSGHQPRLQKQLVQAKAPIIRQAEKLVVLGKEAKTVLGTRTNGLRVQHQLY